jgi:NAD(P)-dependent dehydrogenase (short-subunit alcohol dehydrogenase family)
LKELSGKVAVVTGAASGIGRALAERFAAEGMKVVLADLEEEALRRAEGELQVSGAIVASLRTDVSKAEDVEALAQFAVDAFGAVNVVCNNAGVGVGGVTWQNTVKDWEWVLGVNLWGVIHGVRSFVPRMLAQGDECHVVNTASGAGLHTRPWLAMYCASKHAVVALSESLYYELALSPQTLRDEGSAGVPSQQMQVMEQAFRALLATGLPPEKVAEHVVEAIREERFYILTHEDTKVRVRARMEDILASRNPSLQPTT